MAKVRKKILKPGRGKRDGEPGNLEPIGKLESSHSHSLAVSSHGSFTAWLAL